MKTIFHIPTIRRKDHKPLCGAKSIDIAGSPYSSNCDKCIAIFEGKEPDIKKVKKRKSSQKEKSIEEKVNKINWFNVIFKKQ